MLKHLLLIPAALLGVFLIVHSAAEKKREHREKLWSEKVAAKSKTEEQNRLRREQEAAEHARQQMLARQQQERDRAEAKRQAHEAALRKLTEQTQVHQAEIETLSAEARQLEAQLATLGSARETLDRDVFVLAQNVERRRVRRRVAELEVHRTIKIAVQRFRESTSAEPAEVKP